MRTRVPRPNCWDAASRRPARAGVQRAHPRGRGAKRTRRSMRACIRMHACGAPRRSQGEAGSPAGSWVRRRHPPGPSRLDPPQQLVGIAAAGTDRSGARAHQSFTVTLTCCSYQTVRERRHGVEERVSTRSHRSAVQSASDDWSPTRTASLHNVDMPSSPEPRRALVPAAATALPTCASDCRSGSATSGSSYSCYSPSRQPRW